MFQYEFMQRAFVVGLALAIIMPLIGMVIVLRRLSMLGDSLAHSSLAGVTAGLAFGFNPVMGAVASTILAAFSVEAIRKKFPSQSDLSIAIVTSAGLGITGILTSYVDNAANFNSFLFGSIVSISDQEMYFVLGLSLVVFLTCIFLSRELFYISIDPRGAVLSGVRVAMINWIFTLLIAITVAIASRTVGALIVSSILVIPVASAIQVMPSYRSTAGLALVLAMVSTALGLTMSFYRGLKPGASIVMIQLAILIVAIIIGNIKRSR